MLSATISFAGYVATRLLGSTRGLLVSGLTGAIVSSTAVTASFGQKVGAGEPARPLAGVASVATAISLLRVLVIVLALSPRLLPLVVAPLLAAAVVFVACGSLLMAKRAGAGQDVEARNPFELMPLLVFPSLFAATATLGAAIGNNSLIGISAASGIFDVAVLTALRSVGGAMPLPTVGASVLAAALVNAGASIRGDPVRNSKILGATRPRLARCCCIRRKHLRHDYAVDFLRSRHLSNSMMKRTEEAATESIAHSVGFIAET